MTEEQTLTVSEATFQNMKIMDDIVASMKEIPYLSSDPQLSKDINTLQKVEFRPSGGVYTYMENYEHPYKGFPHYSFVDNIDFIKKISRAVLSGLYHATKNKSKFLFLTLIPVLWISKILLRVGVYAFWRHITRVKVKSLLYCDAIRELDRAFSIFIDGENEKKTEFRIQLRDLICMILEFDNAYRFRFQDVIIELNKENLMKNPRGELIRLLEIMSEREKVQDVKDTWSLIKMFIKVYLLFDKELLKIIKSVLYNLDLSKVALSAEDIQFCKPRQDYNFNL